MSPPGRRSGPKDITPQSRYNVAEIATTTDDDILPFETDSPREAVRRKLAGMLGAEAGTDAWWKSCADAGIKALAETGQIFQAFDILDLGVPEPDNGNRWGPRLLAAARRGVIEPVGYAPSKRPTTACSIVRTWRGVSS